MEKINKRMKTASHSGAGIKVVYSGDEIIVEKTFYGKDPRNEVAIKKQAGFRRISTEKYDIQAVDVDFTIQSNCIIAKMPYVEGISGNQVAIHGNRKLANNIRLSLNFYLMVILAKSRDEKVDKSVVLQKIQQIKDRLVPAEIIAEFNEGCEWVFNYCPATLVIPLGECHGDLTLSNIIITQDNNMYLFDFLDTFIESPLQDISKIIQDMRYGWSFRHERAGIKLKGQLFCEAAFPDYIDVISRIYAKELKVFNVMTILRIAPYIQNNDSETIKWFKRTIIQILRD
jgi:hypothetical protein